MGNYSGTLRQYRGEMSREDILDAVECIRRNSRELLEDAKLLFDNGRYARVVSLATLAMEELMKSVRLIEYYRSQHDPEHRREFWRNYQSHNKKMEGIFLALYGRFSLTVEEGISEDEVKRRAAASNFYKQGGLYADCYEFEGSALWMAPSDLCSKGMAERALNLATGLIERDMGPEDTVTSFAEEAIAAIDQELEGSPGAFDDFLVDKYEQACKQEIERCKQRRIEELRRGEELRINKAQ